MTDDREAHARECLAETPHSGRCNFLSRALADCDCDRPIRAMLAFAKQPEGWRPIETAPKDGTSLLVTVVSTAANTTYGEGGYRYVVQANFEDDLWLGFDCARLENGCWKVTCWQPLPEPAAMLDVAPIPGEE